MQNNFPVYQRNNLKIFYPNRLVFEEKTKTPDEGGAGKDVTKGAWGLLKKIGTPILKGTRIAVWDVIAMPFRMGASSAWRGTKGLAGGTLDAINILKSGKKAAARWSGDAGTDPKRAMEIGKIVTHDIVGDRIKPITETVKGIFGGIVAPIRKSIFKTLLPEKYQKEPGKSEK